MATRALASVSEALSRQGPNALPYADELKYAIRQQIHELVAVRGWLWLLGRHGAGTRGGHLAW